VKRYAMIGAVVGSLLLVLGVRPAVPGEKESRAEHNKLVGTWKMVSAKHDGQDSDQPTRLICLKHITPTHWMWAFIDPATKEITMAATGTYTLEGDKYVELPLYTLGQGVGDIRDKPQSFTWKIEGDKWFHTGTISTGVKLEEVWERQTAPAVEGVVAAVPQEKGTRIEKDTLIGTWKMVSAKYDDQESVLPKQAVCLKHITPTHFMWVYIDPTTKEVSMSATGAYALKDQSYVEQLLYTLGGGLAALRDKPQNFTWKVEGNTWIHTGTLSSGRKLEEVWERQTAATAEKDK
jgi:hypothetical protein